MIMDLRCAIIITIIASGLVLETSASTPDAPPYVPPGIEQAAAIPDDDKRIKALDSALQECLLGKDLERRGAAIGWLSRNSRWLDLSPFEHTLMRLDDIESFNPGKTILDRWELARSPKMHRLAVYREAMHSSPDRISGGVAYGRADRLMPSTAITAATWDGIYELREDILRGYERLAPEVKRSLPVERILIELELRQGAANREEAAFLAAKRLAMIEPAEFRERMNAPIFRESVLDIAKYVCEPNPFTGDLNPGCELVMSIYWQQLGSDESATAPADPLLPGWNAELGDYAHRGMARHNRIIERRRTE
jgi:hypothetical protein